MFENVKNKLTSENDDILYEYVMEEMEKSEPIKGLWAKAMAHSEGNNDKAKSLYMQYRVQSIKDEFKSVKINYSNLSKEELWNTIQHSFSSEDGKNKIKNIQEKKTDEVKYRKIRGWLIFFAILLVLNDFSILSMVEYFNEEYINTLQTLYINDQSLLVKYFNYIFYLDLVGIFLIILFTISFFRKSDVTRTVAIWFFIIKFVTVPLQMYYLNKISPEISISPETIKMVGSLLWALVFLLYFLFSKRVKKTFINKKDFLAMVIVSLVIPVSLLFVYNSKHIKPSNSELKKTLIPTSDKYSKKNQLEQPIKKDKDTIFNKLTEETLNNNKKIELLAPQRKNKKYGFINKNGEMVIQPIYDYVLAFSEGLAKVEINGKCGFINRNGEMVIQPIFNDVKSFSEGLALVKINGKYGFINQQGEIVINATYDHLDSFSEGLAYSIKDKVGFIDKKENIIFTTNGYYVDEQKVSDGLIQVSSRESSKKGFINKKGQWVLPPIYDYAFGFSEGLAYVVQDKRIGYINKKGKWILLLKKHDPGYFVEGLISITINKKFGYMNKKGKIVIKPIYDFAERFSEGLARVKFNGKYGFINQQGEWVIKPSLDWGYGFK